MRVNKIPNGYFEFAEGVLTINGREELSISAQDIHSVLCRGGRKLLLPTSPYGVFECAYQTASGISSCKLLFHATDMEAMQQMCERINEARQHAMAA